MINQMVGTILQQVQEQYPGVAIPAAMRAVITAVEKMGKTYASECKIYCSETGEEYNCVVEKNCYMYAVKILDNKGSMLEQYPELIEIESRQQYEAGDVVQVVFLGNELEAAIVGG